MELYAGPGRRRILPPLVFGARRALASAAARRALRRGAHRVVPVLLAARGGARAPPAAAPAGGRLARGLERATTGASTSAPIGGRVGEAVQALCLRVPQRAFCFSRLHAERLRAGGVRGDVTVLEGEYAGPLEAHEPVAPEPVVVFAGRHIPEKRAPAVVPTPSPGRAATYPSSGGRATATDPSETRCCALARGTGSTGSSRCPGSSTPTEIERALRHALCMVLPSRREGYGMVVIEAAARGDAERGRRGPGQRGRRAGVGGRERLRGRLGLARGPRRGDRRACTRPARSCARSTAEWFRRNARRLSLDASLERVLESYGESARR